MLRRLPSLCFLIWWRRVGHMPIKAGSFAWVSAFVGCFLLAGCGAPEPQPSTGTQPTLGAATFTDVTKGAGLPSAAHRCLVFRDFNGDDKADLLFAEVDD